MKLNGPKQYLLRVAVLASLAALAFAVPKFSLRPAAEPLAAPTSVLTAARAAAPQNDKFVVERVTIFPYGFEPEEITRPVGPFLLAIDNRLGTRTFPSNWSPRATNASRLTQSARAEPEPSGKSRCLRANTSYGSSPTLSGPVP